MATSSAEPPRLSTFVANASTARASAEAERSSVNALYATVSAGSSYRQVQISSLAALATVLESMGANETFVATVRDAVLAADANGGGVVTLDDATIVAALAAAGAGTPPAPVQFDAASMIGEPPTSGFVDDPICAANGNMVHQDTDVMLPAVAGALTITRTWNSLAHDRPGAFGPGWSSMLDVRLDVIGPGAVTAHLADGAAVAFVRDGDGESWTTRARRFLTLRGDEAGYMLALDPVRHLHFDSNGTLTGWQVGVARVAVTRDTRTRVVGLHESVTGRSLAVVWAGDWIESLLLDDGRTVTYERDEHGVARRVRTEAGWLTYRYDNTWLTAVVDPDGVAAFVNEYDELGRVARQTSPFGRVTTYRYAPTGITVISGDDGVRQAMVHDSLGQLTAIIDIDGSAMRLTYDAAGHVVRVVERDGATWRYDYDDRGDLVRRVDPDGGEQRWVWDDRHRLLAETNRAGATWHMEFDGHHRAPDRVIGPDGAVSHQTLDERGLPVRMVDADGVAEHYEWDRNGQLVAIVDGLGARRSIDYDGHGQVTRLSPAAGAPTTLELDQAGRLVRRVRGDEVATYDYTDAGRCRGGTEPGVVGWSATFGDHGAVAEIRDAAGSTVGFDYDALGNVVAVTAPDGAIYRNRFDAVGRHVAAIDPTGAATTKTYDRVGRLIELTEPGGGRWRRELDVLGRTIASIAPDGTATRWTYHPGGEVATVTGPDGRTWRTAVDAAGRPVTVVDPTGGRADIEYTPAGRVHLRRSPAGRVETFEYDAAGRLAAITGVDGVRREFGRDARGFLTRASSPERAVGFEWDDGYRLIGVATDEDGHEARTSIERDAGGRVVSTTDPTGVQARYSWDERGLVATATDPAGLMSRFTRDRRGRLDVQTTPSGGAMRCTYGSDGRVDGSIDPTGARTDYARNADGQVVGLRRSDGSGWDRRLDPLGREIERTDANGASIGRYRYDTSGRMTEAGAADAGPSLSFLWDDNDALVAIATIDGVATIERDADGWVVANTGVDGVRVAYERDAAGRIRAVRIDDDDVALPDESATARDLAGRLTIGRDGTVHRYDHAGRLAELAPAVGEPTRFTYGSDGLVVTEAGPDGRRHFGYDVAGRVTTVRIDGVGTTTIAYDAVGRRALEQRPDGSTVQYRWDGADRLVAIVTESGDGGIRELVVSYDAFGRPVLAGDTSFGYDPVAGACDREGGRRFVNVGSWRYDLTARSWQVPGPGRPAGGAGLTDSLVALGARVLDLATHQFLTADPLPAVAGSNGAASAYTYAWHDPVNYVDPSGLRPISIEEYDAIRTREEQGRVGQAWEAVKSDPWGTLAMVGVAAVGVGLMFVPGGQVIGAGILIGVGTSAAIGFATGTFSPTAVAIGGAFGAIPGGSTLRGAVMLGAASGAGETTLGSVLTGQGLPSWQQLAIGTAIGGGGGAATHHVATTLTRTTTSRLTPPGSTVELDHSPSATVPCGPVGCRPPPNATAEEIAQVQRYVDGSNQALADNALSPTGRISTAGELRRQASRAAAIERARARAAGEPYVGHAGHVPDTTWSGQPEPHHWLDLSPRVNHSLGGQASHYPVGYQPTRFELIMDTPDDG